jgi:hypothetical protein
VPSEERQRGIAVDDRLDARALDLAGHVTLTGEVVGMEVNAVHVRPDIMTLS